jgi:lysozyme
MKTSKTGLDLIKYFEGLHDGDLHEIGLQPKKDPIGIYTEGWGRAMRDKNGNFIYDKKIAYENISIHTIEQANEALLYDVKSFELSVIRKSKRPLKQNEFDALVCFHYNAGSSSTLMQMVNSNNPLLKSWWVSHYITGGGKVLKGLIERRKAECKLYFYE